MDHNFHRVCNCLPFLLLKEKIYFVIIPIVICTVFGIVTFKHTVLLSHCINLYPLFLSMVFVNYFCCFSDSVSSFVMGFLFGVAEVYFDTFQLFSEEIYKNCSKSLHVWNVFISLSHLVDGMAAYRILCSKYFFLSYLKALLHCFLACFSIFRG